MTYADKETSVREGSPIELFRFDISLNSFLYTSQEDDIVDGLDTYIAAPIQRSQIAFAGESNKSNITLTMPRDLAIATEFIPRPPPEPVLLYISRYHTTDSINNKAVIWSGRILDATWKNAICTMNCENIYSSINRTGLQRTYGANCPYTLYDADCGVNVLDYMLNTTIQSFSGTTITSPDFALQPNGYYTGGFIRYDKAGFPSDYRGIIGHTGDTITISYAVADMLIGEPLAASPGCAHTTSDCFNKFGNGNRYGGFPYNPTVNPFNGTTLF